jgi:hypothetical protein
MTTDMTFAVIETSSGIHGAGPTLPAAIADFHAAVTDFWAAVDPNTDERPSISPLLEVLPYPAGAGTPLRRVAAYELVCSSCGAVAGTDQRTELVRSLEDALERAHHWDRYKNWVILPRFELAFCGDPDCVDDATCQSCGDEAYLDWGNCGDCWVAAARGHSPLAHQTRSSSRS